MTRSAVKYKNDLNAIQAAIRSGYSPNSAAEQAYDLLRKPQIGSAIASARAKHQERTQITADKMLREAWHTAIANVRELVQVKVGCCRHGYGEGCVVGGIQAHAAIQRHARAIAPGRGDLRRRQACEVRHRGHAEFESRRAREALQDPLGLYKDNQRRLTCWPASCTRSPAATPAASIPRRATSEHDKRA